MEPGTVDRILRNTFRRSEWDLVSRDPEFKSLKTQVQSLEDLEKLAALGFQIVSRAEGHWDILQAHGLISPEGSISRALREWRSPSQLQQVS